MRQPSPFPVAFPAFRPAVATAATALALAGSLAGCSRPKELYVDHAWVRLAAVPGRPAAAYFTLHGGKAPASLIDVSSPVAIRAELHDTSMAMAPGGAPVARMQPIRAVPVAAKATERFGPGGRHVMLFGLDPSVKAGGALTLTFTFGNGLRIQQTAAVVGAGDPAPKG